MKIAQVNLQRHYGGGEYHVWLLARGLRAVGHDVTLLCPPGTRLHHDATAAGLTVDPMAARGQIDPAATRRLAARLRELRPDVLHLHSAREFLLGTLAGRLAGVPAIVITRHLALPVKPLMRWVYSRGCHGVICASGAVQESLLAASVPRERLAVIYEPVDVAAVRERVLPRHEAKMRLGFAPDVPVVGMAGSLIPAKGQRFLLEAAQRLAQEGSPAQFVFAGQGPQRTELEQLAQTLGITERTHFLGFRTDMPEVLSAFDVFVLPSITGEAFPLAILEAMAAGVPVVGTRLSGIPEAVLHETTGLLVETQDAAGLAQAVGRMLADPALRERAAHEAAARLGRYDIAEMVRHVEAFYRKLLPTASD